MVDFEKLTYPFQIAVVQTNKKQNKQKKIKGVADEKVKNVAILSVRLQLEDGLCKINTTVRVAGIQELKTIYFPAKAFLY